MELNLTSVLYASEAFKEISWRATPLIHNAKEMICNVITNGISALSCDFRVRRSMREP